MFDVGDFVLTHSKNERDYVTRHVQEFLGRVIVIYSRGQYGLELLLPAADSYVLVTQIYFDYELSLTTPTTAQLQQWALAKMKN